MNKILGFIKGNLVIVISVILILVFIPTGYVFSGKWNTKVHEEADSAYKKEKRNITSKGSIEYSLPAVLEGESDLSESRAPNQVVTKFYEAAKAEREEQVKEVIDRGTKFNQGEHAELVPGLLPKAPSVRDLKSLGREMAEAIAGTEKYPSVYKRKLQRLNAGSPMDSGTLSAILTQYKSDEEQRFNDSNADGKMTDVQTAELNKALSDRRLDEYVGSSHDLTFYCSTEAFTGSAASGSRTGAGSTNDLTKFSVVPTSVPRVSSIDEGLVFNWLWDFWVISDMLDAVSLANTDPISGAMSIPEAPIKSVESIRISELALSDLSEDSSSTGGRPGSPSASNNEPELVTLTDRKGGEPGSAFDIRTIEMVVVASSKDLPAFIDAIGKTNYMTVLDMDIDEVDVWGDLEMGYFYGNDHVVRVKLVIESVWLRSWMVPLMPDSVRESLGVPLETSGNPEDDG